MSDSQKPDWLQNQLDTLPDELQPSRDLWPAIAEKLDRRPRSRWLPTAVAASLLISALSALFSWHTSLQHQDTTAATQQLLQQIGTPYQPVLASYRTQWPSIKKKMDPQTAATIEHNLQIIQQAYNELATALDKQPDDPVLQQLVRQTLNTQIDVYRRAQATLLPTI